MTREQIIEQLAMAMQRKDAMEFGHITDGVWHPSWEDIGETLAGHAPYLDDARFAVACLEACGVKIEGPVILP